MWTRFYDEQAKFVADYLKVSDAYHRGQMTEGMWQAWYRLRLSVVLDHVKTKSRFYQKHLSGIETESVSPETLKQLPFTTKVHLQEEMDAVLSGDLRDAQFFYATTGTTGPSTPCPRDKKDIFTNNMQISLGLKKLLEAHLGAHNKPMVAVLAPNELHSVATTLSDICFELGICKVDLWPGSPVVGFQRCIQLLHQLKIDTIITTPGMMLILSQVAVIYGYDIKEDFHIKLILCTGEMCTPAMEENLQSIWGAPVYNFMYGSQEALGIATAAPNKRFVLAKPNYIFEIVHPDSGDSIGSTGNGELCVTMIIDGIKPLIRYRTGDLVTIREDRNLPEPYARQMEVIGRAKDRLLLNGENYSAYEIEQIVMQGIRHCTGYQIVIDRLENRDFITVKLQFLPDSDLDRNKLTEDIRRRSEENLGTPAKVEYVALLDLVVNTGGWVSWKAARVVDHRVVLDPKKKAAMELERKAALEVVKNAESLL